MKAFAAASVAAVVLMGCSDTETPIVAGVRTASPHAIGEAVDIDADSSITIADVLRSEPRFSRFRDLVSRVQTPVADSILEHWELPRTRLGNDRDGVTVFVPINSAFEALDADTLSLLDHPDVDNDLLYLLFSQHYVATRYPSNAFAAGDQPTWRRSRAGAVQLVLDPLTWGGHPIIATDLEVANGLIHVIGGVVVPEEVTTAAAAG